MLILRYGINFKSIFYFPFSFRMVVQGIELLCLPLLLGNIVWHAFWAEYGIALTLMQPYYFLVQDLAGPLKAESNDVFQFQYLMVNPSLMSLLDKKIIWRDICDSKINPIVKISEFTFCFHKFFLHCSVVHLFFPVFL